MDWSSSTHPAGMQTICSIPFNTIDAPSELLASNEDVLLGTRTIEVEAGVDDGGDGATVLEGGDATVARRVLVTLGVAASIETVFCCEESSSKDETVSSSFFCRFTPFER